MRTNPLREEGGDIDRLVNVVRPTLSFTDDVGPFRVRLPSACSNKEDTHQVMTPTKYASEDVDAFLHLTVNTEHVKKRPRTAVASSKRHIENAAPHSAAIDHLGEEEEALTRYRKLHSAVLHRHRHGTDMDALLALGQYSKRSGGDAAPAAPLHVHVPRKVSSGQVPSPFKRIWAPFVKSPKAHRPSVTSSRHPHRSRATTMSSQQSHRATGEVASSSTTSVGGHLDDERGSTRAIFSASSQFSSASRPVSRHRGRSISGSTHTDTSQQLRQRGPSGASSFTSHLYPQASQSGVNMSLMSPLLPASCDGRDINAILADTNLYADPSVTIPTMFHFCLLSSLVMCWKLTA